MRGNKKIFTDEEVSYILDNWNKESIYNMRKKFNCSWNSDAEIGRKHNLDIPKANTWTEEEIINLIQLSKKYRLEDIAKIMNKTENAVYLKARKMGISLEQERRKWTKEDEQTLSELWGTMKIEQLSKKLNRSIYSLKVKAVRMGLGSMMSNNTDILTISDMTDILKITRDKITTWIKLGLKVKEKSITMNKSFYYVEWEELIIFLKEHQDLWDSTSVDLYMLGEEYDWLKEKRKKDIINKPIEYRKWTKDEEFKIIRLFGLGYSYLEIGKIINRSEWAVRNKLNSLGYYLSNRKKWTKEELEYLKENYLKMKYSDIAKTLHKTKSSVEYNVYKNGYAKKRKLKRI